MELGLAEKVALVGGGGHGLGRAAAEVLATEGAAVAIYGRDVNALAAAASYGYQLTRDSEVFARARRSMRRVLGQPA